MNGMQTRKNNGDITKDIINHLVTGKDKSNLFILNVSAVADEREAFLMKVGTVKDNEFLDITELVASVLTKPDSKEGIKIYATNKENAVELIAKAGLIAFMKGLTGAPEAECFTLNSVHYYRVF